MESVKFGGQSGEVEVEQQQQYLARQHLVGAKRKQPSETSCDASQGRNGEKAPPILQLQERVRTLSVEKIPVDTPVSARGTGSAGEKVRRTAGYAEKGRMGPGALFPASLGSSWDLGLLTGPACLVTAGELLGGG